VPLRDTVVWLVKDNRKQQGRRLFSSYIARDGSLTRQWNGQPELENITPTYVTKTTVRWSIR